MKAAIRAGLRSTVCPLIESPCTPGAIRPGDGVEEQRKGREHGVTVFKREVVNDEPAAHAQNARE